MNKNMERIRDALAGAILGAILAVIMFLLSLLNSVVHFAGDLFLGGGAFEVMTGETLVTMIVCLMIGGAIAGYMLGYYATKDEVIRNNINKWLRKHNK